MPRVCADECSFVVSAGSLAPNWAVFGTSYASSRSGTVVFRPMQATPSTSPSGPFTVQRLAYTNNTCRARVVEYSSYASEPTFTMEAGNFWDLLLYQGDAIGTPPADDNAQEISAVRFSTTGIGQDTSIVWPNLLTYTVRRTVQPGQTLHMKAALYYRTPSFIDWDQNLIYTRYVELSYTTWPAA